MVQTQLRIELSATGSPAVEMQKQVAIPYALRPGDNVFDRSDANGNGFDFVVSAAWYDLQSSVQVALMEGFLDMRPEDAEQTKAELFEIGWRY